MHFSWIRHSRTATKHRFLRIERLEDRTVPTRSPLAEPIFAPGTPQEYVDQVHDALGHSDGRDSNFFQFAPKWNTQISVHRYENVGQFDSSPTQKLEYEFGVNRALSHKQWVGISFFRHIQFDGPNDQFSFIKLKYGVGF